MSVPDPATTPWVPVWSMGAGIGLSYKGAWVAGNYNEGDVVISNGVLYMATNATSQSPTGWTMGRAATPLLTSAQMTALVPYDGQEILLIVDATNGINWRLRYNSASASAYKWEFIGGPPLFADVQTLETTTSTSFAPLSGGDNGPSVIAPRAGDYEVRFNAESFSNAAAPNNTVAVKRGAAATSVTDGSTASPATANTSNGVHYRSIWLTGITAGMDLRLYYLVSTGTGQFRKREIRLQPIRLS